MSPFIASQYPPPANLFGPSHAAFVSLLIALIRPGGDVLDAACGTGKYWPALLAAGLRVTGADLSAGRLHEVGVRGLAR